MLLITIEEIKIERLAPTFSVKNGAPIAPNKAPANKMPATHAQSASLSADSSFINDEKFLLLKKFKYLFYFFFKTFNF